MTAAIVTSIERAGLYSPLSFIRARTAALAEHFLEVLGDGVSGGLVEAHGGAARLFVRHLPWDSDWFGIPTYRIEFADWEPGLVSPAGLLAAELNAMITALASANEKFYVFGEVPAEDLPVVQALGRRGFRLIETRITYYTDDLAMASPRDHFPVRLATTEDSGHLASVAASASNPFDRYHADPFYGSDVADGYLATYLERSLNGLANLVLVPDVDDGHSPGAFFTATLSTPPACPMGVDHPCAVDLAVGRIVLVAVGADRQGWHSRLLGEMTRLFHERSMDVACMTTQAANKAVIRNCEKLNYRFGRVSHILAYDPDQAP